MGGSQGHFQLNVFTPLMATNTLSSAQLLGELLFNFLSQLEMIS
jgi:fumarate hydratase class II